MKWGTVLFAGVAMLLSPFARSADDGRDESLDALLIFEEPSQPERSSGEAPQEQEQEQEPEQEKDSYDTIAVGSADEGPADEIERSPGKPRSRMIEEIVVTAQKREEALQDVPISVQAFSGEGLDVRGVESTDALPRITPGLTVTTQVGYTVTYLRGLGSDAFLFADPSVVNYTDGVYNPFPLGQTTNFGDVERIEVLKGPQGTLFGRNAIGGAISVITKDPSLDRTELSAQLAYGSFDAFSARGTLSVPLLDSLAMSVSAIHIDAESHIDGRVNTIHVPGGEPLDRELTDAVRGKLLWTPFDWLQVNLNGYHLDQSGTGTLYAVNVNPSLVARAAGVQAEDPYRGFNNEDIYFDQSVDTLYGQISIFTDAFDIKLFGSDQYIEVAQNYDFDGSDAPLVYFEVRPASSDVQTAEFQILSNDTSWGADWLEWIAGAYYFKSRGGFDRLILRVASTNLAEGTLYGLPVVPPSISEAIRSLGLPIPTGDIETISLLGTDSLSFFMQSTISFGDAVDLTLGGRYQDEERRVLRSTGGLRAANGDLVNYFDTSYERDPELEETTYAFSPKVTLSVYPGWGSGGDSMLYATWQEATKSATYNVINFLDFNPEKVLAEEITAYEVGIKTNMMGGLLTLNAAAFHYTIQNPQIQIVSVLHGGVVGFENAQEARTIGFDFDLLAQILPSVFDGLVLTLNGAYLDTEYTEYTNGTGFHTQTGVLTTGQDFSGNEVVRSPRFSGAVALSQTFNTGIGPFEVNVDYYYNGGFYYRPEMSESSREHSYGVLGAQISYLFEPWNLRVTAYGRNLTDAEYNYSRFITDFGALDARAPLSYYGLKLQYEL
ncbi:MAG: TonB-dependent receptor [Sinimarinibacterium flocculans]|uniref:TonB-dependent receptor n=1 Tax=Sinimarinibacterium flocculans TaxID=985250 RepID=UPI003C52AD2E